MSSPFTKECTAQDVALVLRDQIQGKNVFITGSTVGSLGGEFLRVIVPYANYVWIAGRSEEKLQAAAEAAKKDVPPSLTSASISILKLDLNSLTAVREVAEKVNAEGKPIHVIVNNVATFFTEKISRTEDGFEAQFGVDHLAHFLLNALLLPRLRQAVSEYGKARVVAVSSSMHAYGKIRWEDPAYKLKPEEYERYAAYSQAKLANVLYVRELAVRGTNEGIAAFSLDPGSIMTNGVSEMPKEDLIKAGAMLEDGTLVASRWKTIPQGVATYVAASFDPSIEAKSGLYLVDSQIAEDAMNSEATPENASKLWALSEELLGTKFL